MDSNRRMPEGVATPTVRSENGDFPSDNQRESSSTHLRNALQILGAAQPLDRRGAYVSLERDEFTAIRRRICAALEQIEEPAPASDPRQVRFELTAAGHAALFDGLAELGR